jgi:magnesium transporter
VTVGSAQRFETEQAPVQKGAVQAVLYDADGSDREVSPKSALVKKLGDRQLLWVDLAIGDGAVPEGPWSSLGLEQPLDRAIERASRPRLEAFDHYFHLTVFVVEERDAKRVMPAQLDAFVGPNWILTVHRSTFDLVGTFNRPLKGETAIGALDGALFLATLLNWLLNAYFRVMENLEDDVDRLDERLLTHGKEVDEAALLRQLVASRRRLTKLRRLLAPHRDVFALLAQPDVNVITESDSSKSFERLNRRLEAAIEAVDQIRDMMLGSFEVFMTQTAQQANNVMKVLTVVSVLLLPAVVIAGVMGMNFRVGLFDIPAMFWGTIGIMIVLAVSTLVIARRRKWI